jgi:hypothetical protein
MVSKCANRSCESSFRYFRGGKLFLVEPRASSSGAVESEFREPRRQSEYFWLCEACAPAMTVTADRQGHPIIESILHAELLAG